MTNPTALKITSRWLYVHEGEKVYPIIRIMANPIKK